jgi:hypothetical protein
MEVSEQLHVPAAFIPREITPRSHCIGVCVSLRANVDAVEKRKILPYQELIQNAQVSVLA